MQLNMQVLDRLPVAGPHYQRSRLKEHIVHIGVGGFHRAHQAVYLDELCRKGLSDWSICGAGILPHDERMRDALLAQDGLYTVVERGANVIQARVIGTLTNYLLGPDDPSALIGKMASANTHIVTLTVTEGGYCFDEATGEFDLQHPDIRHDLLNPAKPRGLYGYLLAALRQRRRQGLGPFTLMSCDNVQHNGDVVKNMLLAFADLQDPGMREWLERNGAFPNSMVDRITPVTTDADRAEVIERFAIDDRWPVITEPFRQWVIEDRFCTPRPPWDEAGALFTHDVYPYEMMKIRLLNASHAAMAYLGALSGYETVDAVMNDGLFVRFIRNLMDEEVSGLLPPVPGVDLEDYKSTLLERFANPAIKDQIARLCQDGSNRQPKFILPSIREQISRGGKCRRLILAAASWCRYLAGEDEQGRAFSVVDPLAEKLQRHARAAHHDPSKFLQLHEIYGEELPRSADFVAAFSTALRSLYTKGVHKTLADYA